MSRIDDIESIMKMQREVAILELQKYNRIKNRIMPNLLNKLEYLENQLIGITAMQYSDMPKAEGKRENYTKETLIDEKILIESRIETYRSFIEYVERALDNLNKTDRKILLEYWSKEKVERLKLYDLCLKANISQSTFTRRKYLCLDNFIADVGMEGIL